MSTKYVSIRHGEGVHSELPKHGTHLLKRQYHRRMGSKDRYFQQCRADASQIILNKFLLERQPLVHVFPYAKIEAGRLKND